MPEVFEPVKIGSMQVKNRLVAAPMVSNRATENGNVTPSLVESYHTRARGGWGLVHVEAAYIRPDGKGFARMLGCYSDSQITGLNEVAMAIREGGAKSCIQIMHSGRESNVALTKAQPVAPSEAAPFAGNMPHALTIKEVEEMIDLHVQAAARAKAAGFDAVMLHGAHGFMIAQFMSPYTNRRTDKYGDWKVFIRELMEEVRAAVGKDYPVLMRISGNEYLGNEGRTLEDTVKTYAPFLEQSGVDALDISAGVFETGNYIIQPIYWPRAVIMDDAAAIKQAVNIPVIGVGRINDFRLAEKIIKDGRVDLVAMGRQSLADPDLPQKAMEGRVDDIRQCIACDLGCTYRHIAQYSIDCAINARIFHETRHGFEEEEERMRPAQRPSRVAVVGGGVAGMEVARVATLKGHDVTLFEKSSELGGTVPLASSMPRLYTRELNNIVRWEKKQLEKLGVKVQLGKEVTASTLGEIDPDVVVVATGSKESVPDIPGVDNPKVITLLQYLADPEQAGHRVVVLGGNEGAELAVSLAREGKKVTLLEESSSIGDTPYMLHGGRKTALQGYLCESGATVIIGAKVKSIDDRVVIFTAPEQAMIDGKPAWLMSGAYAVSGGAGLQGQAPKEQSVAADTVIIALGRQPNRALAEAIGREFPEVYEVGDCVRVDSIRHSIHSAAVAAREIGTSYQLR